MRSAWPFFWGTLSGVALVFVIEAGARWLPISTPVWLDILAFFAISGAFGGMLGVLQVVDIPDLFRSEGVRHWSEPRTYNVLLSLGIGAFAGIGGAVAALFAMLIDDKVFPKDYATGPISDQAKLKYIATGVVAGFIGIRLLRDVAGKFADTQIEKVAGKLVDERIDEEKRASELDKAVIEGIAASYDPDPKAETIEVAIRRLEGTRRNFPANRRAAIVLGRLYRSRQELPKAVDVLTDAFTAMQTANNVEAVDRAAVLYNRACYNCLLAADPSRAGQKQGLLEQVYADLDQSFNLDPSNARQAKGDEDFKSIKTEGAFLRLLNRHGVD